MLRVLAEDPFGQLDHIVQTAGCLHTGGGDDDGNHDADDGDGRIGGRDAEDEGKDQHTQAAGQRQKGSALAGSKKNHCEDDD